MEDLDDLDDSIEIEDVLSGHVRGALEGVQTSLPGIVVRTDMTRQRLAVRPTGGVRTVNPDTDEERYQRFAVIEEVPIAFLGVRGFGVTFPIEPGDEVLLVFASHSLESWLVGRDDVQPRDRRRHHVTDAIAIPGISRRPVLPATVDALVVHGDDLRLGGPTATDRVARASDLQALRTILKGAADGIGYGSAVKAALDVAGGWPNCTSRVKAL